MRDEGTILETGERSAFCTTHWSLILAAADGDSTNARLALEQLCEAYWFPLYSYVRRAGHDRDQAQDLTQEFFLRFLEKRSLQNADSARGKFRSFLLSCLKHFLVNEWNKANRQKRGGGCRFTSLDLDESERRIFAEAANDSSPDKAFDRQWALVLLERVLDQLAVECASHGRGRSFEELKPLLTGEDHQASYSEIGLRLGMTETNLKVTVYRMRRRYRELLRLEVARTVDNPQAVDDEIRELFAALRH